MSLSAEAADALFTTGAGPWSVYYRPSRRSPWQLVGRAATHAEAVALIGADGRRGGDWLVSELGNSRPAGTG